VRNRRRCRLALATTVRLCSECGLTESIRVSPNASRVCKVQDRYRVESRWRVCERASVRGSELRCTVNVARQINERNPQNKDSTNVNSQKDATKLYYRLCRSLAITFHAQTRSSSSCRGVTCCASKPGASSPRPDAALLGNPWMRRRAAQAHVAFLPSCNSRKEWMLSILIVARISSLACTLREGRACLQ
jgi:hypothetical protein